MRQYNIPLGSHLPIDDITYLMEGDIDQVNRIADLQDFEGYAVVTIGELYLDKDFDIEQMLDGERIACNKDETIFLIDCGHKYYSNNKDYNVNRYKNEDFKIIDNLDEYFTTEKIVEDLEVTEFKEMHDLLRKILLDEV
jgi:hypothetical protein